jgi:hypothetical protein
MRQREIQTCRVNTCLTRCCFIRLLHSTAYHIEKNTSTFANKSIRYVILMSSLSHHYNLFISCKKLFFHSSELQELNKTMENYGYGIRFFINIVLDDLPQRQESNFPTETFRWEIMSGHKPRVGSTPRHID